MAGGGRAWGGDLTFFKNLPSNSLPQANNSSQMQPNFPGNLSGESPHFVSLNIPFLVKGKGQVFKLYTVIVANEPYTDQLYLQESTWFLFTSVYFDTTVS